MKSSNPTQLLNDLRDIQYKANTDIDAIKYDLDRLKERLEDIETYAGDFYNIAEDELENGWELESQHTFTGNKDEFTFKEITKSIISNDDVMESGDNYMFKVIVYKKLETN